MLTEVKGVDRRLEAGSLAQCVRAVQPKNSGTSLLLTAL